MRTCDASVHSNGERYKKFLPHRFQNRCSPGKEFMRIHTKYSKNWRDYWSQICVKRIRFFKILEVRWQHLNFLLSTLLGNFEFLGILVICAVETRLTCNSYRVALVFPRLCEIRSRNVYFSVSILRSRIDDGWFQIALVKFGRFRFLSAFGGASSTNSGNNIFFPF